jgi:aminoglycoside phosphotransferase (APT) family kinase protein
VVSAESPEQPARARGFEGLLASVEPGRGGKVTMFRPISGGYSRETAMAEVQWNDGSTEKFILRCDPIAGEGVFQSDRDDEWELLQALAKVDTFEIPRPRWYDATGEHFGSKAIVMDFCEGTPLQLTLPGVKDFRAPTDVYLEVAASFQRTPVDGMPAHLGQPASWDDHIEHAIEIYERAEHDIPDCSPVVRYACAWLRANRPPPVPLGLVHGDFQPGNILVAEGRTPIVIDWEFACVGDPREDVGYYSGSPLPNSLYEADRTYFLERYRELTGMNEDQVNEEVLEYFFILGMAKLYAQMMDGAAAVAQGRGGSVMNVFLINSLLYFQGRYLDICSSSHAGAKGARS